MTRGKLMAEPLKTDAILGGQYQQLVGQYGELMLEKHRLESAQEAVGMRLSVVRQQLDDLSRARPICKQVEDQLSDGIATSGDTANA